MNVANARPVAVRLAWVYGTIFFIVGLQTAYLPAWLLARGMTEAGIGIILSIPMLVRVVTTPLITFGADRFQRQRQTMVVLAWGVLASVTALAFAHSFIAILLAMICVATFWTTVMPMTEALTMRGVRALGLEYGHIRLWGSLTFIAASLVGGWVLGRFGAEPVVPMMIAAAVALVLASHVILRAPFPTHQDEREAGAAKRIEFRDVVALLTDNRFLFLFVASGVAQATHAVYYAFGTIHWQSIGMPTTLIGVLWAIGVIAEIALFLIAGRVLRWVGSAQLICLGAIAGMVRWGITSFDPSFGVLCGVQVLHGLTFGATHLGAVHLIADLAGDDRAATAQGLHSTFAAGIFMAAAIAASGPLYRSLNGGAYLAMMGLSLVAAIAAVLLIVSLKRQPQSAGSGG